MTPAPGLSAIVAAHPNNGDLVRVHAAYSAALDHLATDFELLYVFDERDAATAAALRAIQSGDRRVRLVGLSRWFGEAAAMSGGFQHARGEIILVLPAYLQVDAAEIPKLVEALDGHDMVVGRRWPEPSPAFKLWQARAFHGVVGWLFGSTFNDLGCRVRACRRAVLDEINVYGAQHRFLPLVVSQAGFAIREVKLRGGDGGAYGRLTPMSYGGRFLDLLALYVLLRFTKRPLRFFGLIGVPVLLIGALATAILVGQRLFFGDPLADRPALVLAVLMVVLGIQIIAVGLIGEIIIFAHGRQIKDYAVDRVIE